MINTTFKYIFNKMQIMLLNSNGHLSTEKNKKLFIDFMMDNCHDTGFYYDDLTDENKKLVKQEKINNSKKP